MTALTTTLLALLPAAPLPPQANWFAEKVMLASDKLNGCAIGELDTSSRYVEIASVSADGGVYLTRQNGPEAWPWVSERLADLPGELIGCVIGDIDPRFPGNELVVFGMAEGREDPAKPGAAYVIASGPDGYEMEDLHTDTGLIHAGVIGDLDPDRPANAPGGRYELALTGYSGKVHLIHFDGEEWKSEVIAETEGGGKALSACTNGVALGCADGKLYQVVKSAKRWHTVLYDDHRAAQSRIAFSEGNILSARDDGTLTWIMEQGKRSEIYRSKEKLRGAAIADLDPFARGLEAATAGYDKKLVVLYGSRGTWKPQVIYEDSADFHHVTSGEVDPRSPGAEIVACGSSRYLIVAGLLRELPKDD